MLDKEIDWYTLDNIATTNINKEVAGSHFELNEDGQHSSRPLSGFTNLDVLAVSSRALHLASHNVSASKALQ